jgi:predicted ATP-binding protein involved in virulence
MVKPKNTYEKDHSYFLSLELENLNCFKEKQTLDLSDGNNNYAPWTIILGDNGTGKTTLLKVLDRMQLGYYLTNDRILLERPLIEIKNKYLHLNNDFHYICKFSNNITLSKNIKEFVFAIDTQFQLSYGASRRMNKNPNLSSKENDNLKLTSLFDETIELINVEEWVLEKFLKTKIAEDTIKQNVENQLELVKNLLVEILPDVNSIRIKPLENVNSKIIVEVATTFGWVNIKDLSYGYQTITALIVDIAANMMEKYPESENPLREPVIILIDEIDLHLHPKWQRTVINKFSKYFPKAQFIVTAHSPLIVQAAESVNANIVVCRKEEDKVIIDNNPDNVKGWRIDQILTSDLFELENSRADNSQKAIDDYIYLKGKENLNKDESLKLENLIPLVKNSYQNTENTESELDKKLKEFSKQFLHD